MFLIETTRFNDSKKHHWSLVENQRVDGGCKWVQWDAVYLREINLSQQAVIKTRDAVVGSAANCRFV